MLWFDFGLGPRTSTATVEQKQAEIFLRESPGPEQ
jgi:hypothetical protein